jgi:hypothetical protein
MTLDYISDMIERKNPIVNHIESNINDVPIFKINSTSFFHFLNIMSFGSLIQNDGIDFTKLRTFDSKGYYSI